MLDSWVIYGGKQIKDSALAKAAAEAFLLPSENVKIYKDIKSINKETKIYIKAQKRVQSSENFYFQFIITFDSSIFSDDAEPDKSGFNDATMKIARKLAPCLGIPLIGSLSDFNRNDIYYYKCYPDGREERVEWPDED